MKTKKTTFFPTPEPSDLSRSFADGSTHLHLSWAPSSDGDQAQPKICFSLPKGFRIHIGVVLALLSPIPFWRTAAGGAEASPSVAMTMLGCSCHVPGRTHRASGRRECWQSPVPASASSGSLGKKSLHQKTAAEIQAAHQSMGTQTSPKHRRKKSLLLIATISVFVCFFSGNIKMQELIKLLSLCLYIYFF